MHSKRAVSLSGEREFESCLKRAEEDSDK
jgi:hypothetical protein